MTKNNRKDREILIRGRKTISINARKDFSVSYLCSGRPLRDWYELHLAFALVIAASTMQVKPITRNQQ